MLSYHLGGQPDLKVLWFGQDSESSSLRLTCFLSVFGCEELSVEQGQLEGSLLAVLCLVTYITIQVRAGFRPGFPLNTDLNKP